MVARRRYVRALARRSTVASAARFLEDRLDSPRGLEEIAIAAAGGRITRGQLTESIEAARDPGWRARVLFTSARWLVEFLDLDERAKVDPHPSVELVEKSRPTWVAVASTTTVHAGDPGPPPRLRDTELCLAAPHGPTVAGVMPAAA